jgi:AcrR family transcriptional regulator
MVEARRRRANGEVSRERILDATAEIAGERGYEGTSINLISERSGLPASSIYWHFRDKDELIAAVIDRSFNRWITALETPTDVPAGTTPEQWFHVSMQRTGAAIAQFPDYLRLGLMLVLERRPQEPTARQKFVEVRHVAMDRTQMLYSALFGDLSRSDINKLVTLTIALADGLFVAQDAGEVELGRAFDLVATAILGTADQLRGAKQHTAKSRARKVSRH